MKACYMHSKPMELMEFQNLNLEQSECDTLDDYSCDIW